MMSGIRVLNLPKEWTEKRLKIYFSKPENGGGRIRKIYFPLFHNDAVILFESKRGIESCFDHYSETFLINLQLAIIHRTVLQFSYPLAHSLRMVQFQ